MLSNLNHCQTRSCESRNAVVWKELNLLQITRWGGVKFIEFTKEFSLSLDYSSCSQWTYPRSGAIQKGRFTGVHGPLLVEDLQRFLSSSSCRFVSFLRALKRESEMKGKKTSLFIFSFFPLFFSCCIWTCRLFYIQYLSSTTSAHMLFYVVFALLLQYRAVFLDSEEDANIWAYGREDSQRHCFIAPMRIICSQST